MPGSPAPQRDAALPVDRREGELRGVARADAGGRRGQERAGEGLGGVGWIGAAAAGWLLEGRGKGERRRRRRRSDERLRR